MLRGAQRMAVLCAVVVGLVAFSVTVGSRSFQPRTFDFDLVAFYCGGTVTAAHGDPYRVEPLRTCEHAIGPVFRRGSPLAVPDPLPPYDQALFAAISIVPYPAVQILWFLAIVAACATTVVILAGLTRLPAAVVACSLVISDLYCSSLLGQMLPFCVLGIALTGWALERDKRPLATLGLVLAMTEPHLGLPALAAVTIWNRRFLSWALLACAILAIGSVALTPASTILEYFSAVIPAHAFSEINNQEQFSLAYAAHALGVSETLSVELSKIEYAGMLVLGVALARAASKEIGIAIVPFGAVAFVLVGGPFLHVTQMAAALPAALLVASRSRSKAAAAAACLLAIPWADFATVLTVLPVAGGALYYVIRSLWNLDARRSLALVSLAIGSITASAFYVATHLDRGIPRYANVDVNALAETTWRSVVDFDRHGHVVLSSLAKLPTECAVLLVVGAIASAASHARAVPVRVYA